VIPVEPQGMVAYYRDRRHARLAPPPARPTPACVDPVVFGVPLVRHEVYEHDPVYVSTCRACGVRWAGLGPCWCCGGTG